MLAKCARNVAFLLGVACGPEPASPDAVADDGSSGAVVDATTDGGGSSDGAPARDPTSESTTAGDGDPGDASDGTTGGVAPPTWCFDAGRPSSSLRFYGLTTVRVDHDELDDLVGVYGGKFLFDGAVRLFRNEGGAFESTDGVNGIVASHIDHLDIDGDGLVDLVDEGGNVFIEKVPAFRRNAGDGTLAEPQPLVEPEGGAAIVERAGAPAAAIRREGSTLRVWPGIGDGTFGRELAFELDVPAGSTGGLLAVAPELHELALPVHQPCEPPCTHLRYLMIAFDGVQATQLGIADVGENPDVGGPRLDGLHDFDGDGHADPATLHEDDGAREYRVHLSSEGYEVGLVLHFPGHGGSGRHATGDIDGDGRTDIVTFDSEDDDAGVDAYLSSLSHAPVTVAATPEPWTVHVVDLDDDGLDDVLVNDEDVMTPYHSRACPRD